jgi:hypothetical protein
LDKNKTKTINRLCAELEEVTKKTKDTIKERVGKKLCNLTYEQINAYMINNKDISFDKKRLN